MTAKTIFSFRKMIATFVIFITVGAGILCWYISGLSQNLVKTTALQSGVRISKMLTEFRTLYTRDVVERVRPLGVEVTHDYLNKPNAIPLPVTFSMELGKRISGAESQMETRLGTFCVRQVYAGRDLS